jgi:putative endonuclease
MTMDTSSGQLGEAFACALLQKQGAVVIARNYHSRWGEVDIIARKDRYLLFVEVKTRSFRSSSAPQAAVTMGKQKKILRTAVQFMTGHPSDLQPRFDVIALTTEPYSGRVIDYQYIENAFGAGGGGYAPF